MSELAVENEQTAHNTDDLRRHVSVMMEEVIQYLRPQAGGTYVDGTLGLGGHAMAILKHVGPQGRLIGIDRDAASLSLAGQYLSSYRSQCLFIQNDFRQLNQILIENNVRKVDGIVLDLGISSFQLDDPERGFSLRADGPLDMRMDQKAKIMAFDLINSLSEKEISSILRDYGEERWHQRIARKIVRERGFKPIETTKELRHIVMQAVPLGRKRQRIHPATRTFQALRIAVNQELDNLEFALEQCFDHLKEGGRFVVISFHSLEDRIVKQKFVQKEKQGFAAVLLKKPLRPKETELERNPRARSARLRAVEKTS